MSRPPHARAAALSLVLVLVATIAGAGAQPARAADPPAPSSLNLFVWEGYLQQDPNYTACTASAAMMMLNFSAYLGTGGSGFRWVPTVEGATRDQILAWERTHDTLRGGRGSDPHGWRNALNYFGYGPEALWQGARVYEDFAYANFETAVKVAVRQMIRFGKPVGLLAWAGRHSQVLHGYWGLSGDPFARDASGRFTNAFTVAGFYISDPLASQGYVNKGVYYRNLRLSSNLRLRFRAYLEYDSPYDDRYSPGTRASRNEWYRRFVIIAPVR